MPERDGPHDIRAIPHALFRYMPYSMLSIGVPHTAANGWYAGLAAREPICQISKNPDGITGSITNLRSSRASEADYAKLREKSDTQEPPRGRKILTKDYLSHARVMHGRLSR